MSWQVQQSFMIVRIKAIFGKNVREGREEIKNREKYQMHELNTNPLDWLYTFSTKALCFI